MKSLARAFLAFLVLISSWTLVTFHRGVFPKPPVERIQKSPLGSAHWIDRKEMGIHQLVLSGNDFERGYLAGEKTQHLLRLQEESLNTKLDDLIPSKAALFFGRLLLLRWYWGIDRFFEPWAVDEMYGVGQWAPHEYDYLADGFTRQAAYHGLHEVAQLMVDQGIEDMGCTVAALPVSGSWVLGRNFDFEGGAVFDQEKIMKWVFPDKGYAYVSVIWAGMVGAVTGVNERGIYISMNAAGSSDFKRHGTPSTLLITKALQNASSILEAVKIISEGQMFITDIFVVADRNSSQLLKIEKSPDRIEVLTYTQPVAIANHLVGKSWDNDQVNEYRKREQTTTFRAQRGQTLLDELAKSNPKPGRDLNLKILSIVRDKSDVDGKVLHLGNRRAIDALIAAHSVVFDGPQNRLYVGEGPSVSGKFLGFDLQKSFSSKTPTVVEELPSDPLLSKAKYDDIKKSFSLLAVAKGFLKRRDCDEGKSRIERARSLFPESSMFSEVEGNYFECVGNKEKAREYWTQALERRPAYFQQAERLKEKLK